MLTLSESHSAEGLGPPAAPVRRRLTPDARRAELLRAGAELFTEKAFDDVSIEDIAEVAGVSKNLLYHYFSGKRELYIGAVRAATQDMVERSEPDMSLERTERIRNAIDNHLRHAEEHMAGYIKLVQGAGNDPEIQAIIDDAHRQVVERTIATLPLGGTEPHPGLVIALYGWIGFCNQATIAWLDRRTMTRDELREMLAHQFVGILAASIRTDRLPDLGP